MTDFMKAAHVVGSEISEHLQLVTILANTELQPSLWCRFRCQCASKNFLTSFFLPGQQKYNFNNPRTVSFSPTLEENNVSSY